MSVFSFVGKLILCFAIACMIIGGSAVYLLYTYVNPQIEKLSTLDQINYELEERGEQPIAMNPLTGAISRE